MKILDDYACEQCGLVEELYVERGTQTVKCRDCEGVAARVRSVPNFQLPGNCAAGFPTAYDKWNKNRMQKIAEEKRRDS